MNILLGITGSIAAYKSAELLRLWRKQGINVRVVMTKSALEFIQPLTFAALSGHPVAQDHSTQTMEHIDLAKWADIIFIAPSSANMIAKLAHGIADDVLSTTCLASTATLHIAPAMNQQMWKNKATQHNISILQNRNVKIHFPGEGEQACGDNGPGRMLEPEILATLISPKEKILLEKKILVTAGPTIEKIDPVRYISNYSSGKMGYALAKIATELGAEVILISGPTNLPPPKNVSFIPVKSAQEMHEAVMSHVHYCDIFIATAAVADYRSEKISKQKIKKKETTKTLTLIKNPDILADVASLRHPPITVGFCAETEDLLEHAHQKLIKKNIDMIAANWVGENLGFNQENNAVILLCKDGQKFEFPLKNKELLAHEILQAIGTRVAIQKPTCANCQLST